MKIHPEVAIQPSRFADRDLNFNIGLAIGRLSNDDMHVLAFAYAERRVAALIRNAWARHGEHTVTRASTNKDFLTAIRQGSTWDPLADEATDFLYTDRQQLDREHLLACMHMFLCDRVIAELTNAFTDVESAAKARRRNARDESPLRHLQQSLRSALKAPGRRAASQEAWNRAVEGFHAEAKTRNDFAKTSGSMKISTLDQSSPAMFEERIAWLLERDGCTLERRHGFSGDHGADVIAITPAGYRVVLQCKHSVKAGHRVDPRAVFELNGTAKPEHNADTVGIVTNRAISNAAAQFAAKNGIHVIDRPVLQRWATYGWSWLRLQEPATDEAGAVGD